MKQILLITVFGLLIMHFTCNDLLAQEQNLSKKEKDEALNAIVKKVERFYPFPELSREIIKRLNEQIAQSFYDRYKTPNEFATQVTMSLKSFSNDKHYNLSYNPSLAKSLIEEESTDSDDTAFTAGEAKSEVWNNYGFKELSILDGNIGYLNLSVFFATNYAGKTADNAMNYFYHCNALIIDLRQNGGGWGDMVDYLLGYFVDNTDPLLLSIGQSTLDSSYYSSVIPCYVQGRKLTDIPIYILTSSSTASAAEAFTTHIKYFSKNVTIVGEKTKGAENPVHHFSINENFVLQIPCWKRVYSRNPQKWEGVGINPDIEVEVNNAQKIAHLLALEKLIANTTDDFTISKYQWAIDGQKAGYNNATKSDIQKFKGDYGDFKIIFKDSKLYLKYKNRANQLLTPITENYFIVEGAEHYRIKFEIKGKRLLMKRIYTFGVVREDFRKNNLKISNK